MTKDKVIAALWAIAISAFFLTVFLVFKPVVSPSQLPLGAAMPFSYNSATQATSSVGIYAWSTVLPADSGRGYVSLCNDSRTANSDIYLGFGATSTVSGSGMFGRAIPSNSCYEMTLDNMFYGNIYAIASSATSTLLTVRGGY